MDPTEFYSVELVIDLIKIYICFCFVSSSFYACSSYLDSWLKIVYVNFVVLDGE